MVYRNLENKNGTSGINRSKLNAKNLGSILKVVCEMKRNYDFCKKELNFESVSRVIKADPARVLNRTF